MSDESNVLSELEKEKKIQAVGLERCAIQLLHYAMCLRGDEVDMTGMGAWRIFLANFEQVANVKVIEPHQFDYFVNLEKQASDEDRRKAYESLLWFSEGRKGE